MTYYANFAKALDGLSKDMKEYSQPIKPMRWQSIDVSNQPAAEMRELLHVTFQAPMAGEDLEVYRQQIKPNLPWADDHFLAERVSGHPVNPGWTWKHWPWGHSADKFRREGEQYSHSYAERYWPKYAGMANDEGGILPEFHESTYRKNLGIRYAYGDLGDVVDLLVRDPETRQAYLPIWFPEDTGVTHGERVPCTLGYHFMMRNENLHVYYPIRSCDFYRHLRDDLYLTVRLVLWMLDRCREKDPTWKAVRPGMFSFWAGSLHCFINDFRVMYANK